MLFKFEIEKLFKVKKYFRNNFKKIELRLETYKSQFFF